MILLSSPCPALSSSGVQHQLLNHSMVVGVEHNMGVDMQLGMGVVGVGVVVALEEVGE